MNRSEGCALREARKRERLLNGGFWKRVDSSAGPDACWPWTGRHQTKDRYGHGGYGVFMITRDGRRKEYYVHRRALEVTMGRLLVPGEIAMHSCDNPPCCNPAHLRAGTKADNSADMAAKGRAARSNVKLTLGEVQELRQWLANGVSQRLVGIAFGVSRGAVAGIAQGRSWKGIAA